MGEAGDFLDTLYYVFFLLLILNYELFVIVLGRNDKLFVVIISLNYGFSRRVPLPIHHRLGRLIPPGVQVHLHRFLRPT
jgi:hypothetical protein